MGTVAIRRNAALVLAGVVLGVVAPAAAGPPVLSVDDVVVLGGEEARLVAYVEREPVLGIRQDVEDVKVRFFVEGREVGHDDTNDDGRASVKVKLPPTATSFQARVDRKDRMLTATGKVFAWSDKRVIIAVDVDDTIARTDYTDLVFDDEDEIDPLKRAAKTMRAIAADFHIVYLTARPRFLQEKTRMWLEREEFPPGPLITAKGLRQTARQETFKRRKIEELRDEWPLLLIGIGNKDSDAAAYGASDMLSIMIETKDGDEDFGRHSIVFLRWKDVGRFFDANRDALTDPARLKEVIKGKRMLLRPVRPWRKP